MEKLLDILSSKMGEAFEAAGFDALAGRVSISNRPDLCEYQCNGAMALAKKLKKNPMEIAEAVKSVLQAGEMADQENAAGQEGRFSAFSEVEAAKPGFLNFNVSPAFLRGYAQEMADTQKYGYAVEKPLKFVIDYGGPNVAKPLHVGHLRAAVIGESIKRILRFAGHEVIGDIHMGDWGLQMGLIITEIRERQPALPYFDEAFQGDYPAEAPFTISELEEIYPAASAKSKADAEYKAKAMEATKKLQEGERGHRALWQKIIDVSVADLKKNYEKLDVHFDLWNGESTVNDEIAGMVEYLKEKGYAYESDGALVVDVAEETDKKPIPPCMILKSDGAALYNTTDLATLLVRNRDMHPDEIVYVVDKRQDLYFEQVFRCAKKTGLVDPEIKLVFIGFGTMNGKDGKPFKTREGGVMRLEALITEIEGKVRVSSVEGDIMSTKDNKLDVDSNIMSTGNTPSAVEQIALAALKYGDLSNQATKDYCFDMDKFTSFEGDTGPYLLYTIVRIKSILRKHGEASAKSEEAGSASEERIKIKNPSSDKEKALLRSLCGFNAAMASAEKELAPHRLCAYAYELSNTFNSFYHETKILAEEDAEKKEGYISLIRLTLGVLETLISLLGFSAPERM
ncbi:MAG: arginine--tRNA ligase [Lachnospiraceae bacterium]|nr:arginine--tRNA ligase [Lachnospiraceae bacterium]